MDQEAPRGRAAWAFPSGACTTGNFHADCPSSCSLSRMPVPLWGGSSLSAAGEGVHGALGESSLQQSWVLLPGSRELRAEAPVVTSVARHGATGQTLWVPAGLGLRPLSGHAAPGDAGLLASLVP